MKKLFGILILMFSVVLLVGCGSDDSDKISDQGVIKNMSGDESVNINEEKNKETEKKEIGTKKEYKMEINMEMKKNDKKMMEGKYKIYKKDGDAYTEIIKFEGEEISRMPFKPLATLSKGGKNYTQMEINGEKQRFLAEDMSGEDPFELFDDKMFDVNIAKEELKNIENVQKSNEKFDGNDVECYAFSEEGGKIKLCINEDKGYVSYVQSEFNGEKTIMSVSNFDNNVDDSVFELPKNAKPITELGKIMMRDEFKGMTGNIDIKNTEDMK